MLISRIDQRYRSIKKVFSGLQQLKHPGSQFPKIYFQMLADKTYINHNVVICEPDMAALKPSRKKIEVWK